MATFGDGGFILESELAIFGDGGFILDSEVAILGDGGFILENEVAVFGAAGFIRVGSALVTSGLVTMAFLLALRLLIRDFFEIDIACSLVFGFD